MLFKEKEILENWDAREISSTKREQGMREYRASQKEEKNSYIIPLAENQRKGKCWKSASSNTSWLEHWKLKRISIRLNNYESCGYSHDSVVENIQNC